MTTIDIKKKVRCIDNGLGGENHLVIGQIYEVSEDGQFHYRLTNASTNAGGWGKHRFVEIKETQQPEPAKQTTTKKRVKCIDNGSCGEDHLVIGQIYEVLESEYEYCYVLDGVAGGWLKHRFEVVNDSDQQVIEAKPVVEQSKPSKKFVRAIKTNHNHWVSGAVFEVIKETPDYYYVGTKAGDGWDKCRFEVVEGPKAKVEPQKVGAQPGKQDELVKMKRVKCIAGTGYSTQLCNGQVYEVVVEDLDLFYLKGKPYDGWNKTRFEVVEEPKPEVEQAKMEPKPVKTKKVKCIDARNSSGMLIYGKVYEVECEKVECEVAHNYGYTLKGVKWNSSRFEIIDEAQSDPIAAIKSALQTIEASINTLIKSDTSLSIGQKTAIATELDRLMKIDITAPNTTTEASSPKIEESKSEWQPISNFQVGDYVWVAIDKPQGIPTQTFSGYSFQGRVIEKVDQHVVLGLGNTVYDNLTQSVSEYKGTGNTTGINRIRRVHHDVVCTYDKETAPAETITTLANANIGDVVKVFTHDNKRWSNTKTDAWIEATVVGLPDRNGGRREPLYMLGWNTNKHSFDPWGSSISEEFKENNPVRYMKDTSAFNRARHSGTSNECVIIKRASKDIEIVDTTIKPAKVEEAMLSGKPAENKSINETPAQKPVISRIGVVPIGSKVRMFHIKGWIATVAYDEMKPFEATVIGANGSNIILGFEEKSPLQATFRVSEGLHSITVDNPSKFKYAREVDICLDCEILELPKPKEPFVEAEPAKAIEQQETKPVMEYPIYIQLGEADIGDEVAVCLDAYLGQPINKASDFSFQATIIGFDGGMVQLGLGKSRTIYDVDVQPIHLYQGDYDCTAFAYTKEVNADVMCRVERKASSIKKPKQIIIDAETKPTPEVMVEQPTSKADLSVALMALGGLAGALLNTMLTPKPVATRVEVPNEQVDEIEQQTVLQGEAL